MPVDSRFLVSRSGMMSSAPLGLPPLRPISGLIDPDDLSGIIDCLGESQRCAGHIEHRITAVAIVRLDLGLRMAAIALGYRYPLPRVLGACRRLPRTLFHRACHISWQ